MRINNLEKPNNISYYFKGIEIPSRFFFAPINTGLCEDGLLSEEFFDFYRERSHSSIGINYIGNVAIDPKYVTNPNTAYFTNQTVQWEMLVKSIRKQGSVPGIQIACRNSSIIPIRKMINNNIEAYLNTVRKDIVNIPKEEIQDIIKKFIDTSIKASDLGFDVIQIHAAHGYFLSQLISKSLNIRDDEYNASDLFFLKTIISGIREKKPNLIIDLRISFLEGIKNDIQEKVDKDELIKKLIDLDIDIISFSNGIYDINKQLIYPLEQWGHACFLKNILKYADQYPNILWNYSGNIWDLGVLQLENIPNNLSFSLGRALIADPLFVEKSLNNKNELINRCEFKNKCHYYSLNLSHIGCPIYELNKNVHF
ncbi:hypothetical protein [Bacillus altitudinis]|uniref:oxidoreductase n=1 Tax=Bacillus altitudinis TaxID=293387 RepID=UPI000912EA0E|nr:hypothetical protein [Bacillus altitudinis]MDN0041634.1 hypothetical protein [Bacillus aerophilus]SFY00728.1 2,4-dienoyl-CoA reductase [Bacillus altitudinis]SNS33367.1 2,4-dienoyl-CoA reductase [Bacillus altitudinis]